MALERLAANGLLWPMYALRPPRLPPGASKRFTERGLLWSVRTFRRRLVTSSSDACIEGFPRSGNSFTVFVFAQWNPGARVANHLHIPLQVRRAVRLGVPTCVIVRQPLDVVTALALHGGQSDDALFTSYIRFHRRVAALRDGYVTCRFEELTDDPSIVVARLNARFGTDFACWPLTPEAREWALAALRAMTRLNDYTASDPQGPFPTAEKERLKERLRPRMARHPLLADAEAAYRAVCGDLPVDVPA